MQKTNPKTFLLLILALFLVIGLSGCGQKPVANTNIAPQKNINQAVNNNTNTTNGEEIDISDWKTYKNEEYGFRINYPKDWEIKENVLPTTDEPLHGRELVSFSPKDREFQQAQFIKLNVFQMRVMFQLKIFFKTNMALLRCVRAYVLYLCLSTLTIRLLTMVFRYMNLKKWVILLQESIL